MRNLLRVGQVKLIAFLPIIDAIRSRSKSRSPYGERHRRGGRNRSTSRDRRDKRDDDKRDDDRRREREKKGLPPMRKGYLSGKYGRDEYFTNL